MSFIVAIARDDQDYTDVKADLDKGELGDGQASDQITSDADRLFVAQVPDDDLKAILHKLEESGKYQIVGYGDGRPLGQMLREDPIDFAVAYLAGKAAGGP